jgi:iron complex outermembrane receptor protein
MGRFGASAAILMGLGSAPALAQSVLPPIVVVSPSPIGRPGGTAAEPGVLPIVTDQFATVTVVPGDELRRAPASTLGDLLFAKPGITGSSFAPGAASRPIIRGLDVNRVGIVENGVGAGGVSDLGEDHFVPVTPLMSDQIEVIRGPATLRYGSQSIGGVVSSTNNRIPDRLPCGAPCARFDVRGAGTSVDGGLEGGVRADAGFGNLAIHADAFGRTAGDYRVPHSPYLFDPARPFIGRQPNSGVRTDGQSIGASYVFDQGFVGAAITQNNALYRIPGIDGEDHRTRIDARETKFTAKGEFRPMAHGIEAVRFWFGATDYRHNELGLADPLDATTDGVRQTFTNREQEGRVELQSTPFDLRFAALTTALGVQAGQQKLTAPGDAPGPLSGLFAPNDNARIAGYVFNELKFSDWTKAQVAGRIEQVRLNGTSPDFPADFLPDGGALDPTQRAPRFTPKSISVGLIQDLPYDLVASITGQRVERAPKPAELFSRGPHDATATFDIGNPNLGIEVAHSVEVGLRRAKGPLRFEATAYYTRFSGFIYRRLSGVMCDEDFDSCGNPAGELNQAVYSQRDAIFRGGEFQAQYDIAPVLAGVWGVEGQFDVVRATFTDGTNVPRITPMRAGGGLFYRDGNWLARVNLVHAFPQNNIAANETPTDGYNLLKAEVSYTRKFANAMPGDLREFTVGVVGNNLLNEDIRNHVSYTKNEVLMPGVSVRGFASVRF